MIYTKLAQNTNIIVQGLRRKSKKKLLKKQTVNLYYFFLNFDDMKKVDRYVKLIFIIKQFYHIIL